MKVTFEFEHPCEFVSLLKALIELSTDEVAMQEYDFSDQECDDLGSLAGTEHELCDAPDRL